MQDLMLNNEFLNVSEWNSNYILGELGINFKGVINIYEVDW